MGVEIVDPPSVSLLIDVPAVGDEAPSRENKILRKESTAEKRTSLSLRNSIDSRRIEATSNKQRRRSKWKRLDEASGRIWQLATD